MLMKDLPAEWEQGVKETGLVPVSSLVLMSLLQATVRIQPEGVTSLKGHCYRHFRPKSLQPLCVIVLFSFHGQLDIQPSVTWVEGTPPKNFLHEVDL